jgi:hypothetical protein
VNFVPLDTERRLEDLVANDVTLIGVDLLMIAGQVRTDFGGTIDILAYTPTATFMCLNSSEIAPLGRSSPKRWTTGPRSKG